MIPGGASYKTLDKIGYLEHIAADPAQPTELRAHVTAELARIDAGAPVHPIYESIRATASTAQDQRETDLHQIASDALSRAKNSKTKKRTPRPIPSSDGGGEPMQYPVRAFVLTWGELADWWTRFQDADGEQRAQMLMPEQAGDKKRRRRRKKPANSGDPASTDQPAAQ